MISISNTSGVFPSTINAISSIISSLDFPAPLEDLGWQESTVASRLIVSF